MWYHHDNNVVTINVYIQPGAKYTKIMGIQGGALKIRLASPPIDGRANKELLKYIATLFDVTMRQVKIKHGEKSRNKIIIITGSKINTQDIWPSE